MTHTINPSRRRFFAQTGFGLMAYAGMPGWLRAMEGMGEMPKMPRSDPPSDPTRRSFSSTHIPASTPA